MTEYEYNRTKAQLKVVRELLKEYSGKTIDNVAMGLEARIKHYETNKH